MFELEADGYRREMDQVGIKDAYLDHLTESVRREAAGRRRGRRVGRGLLVAAALCTLCAVSTLALSPTLQDALNDFLGAFIPYTQKVEDASCVANGIEIRAVSALADSSMVRVFAEARDVSGQDRLSAGMDTSGLISRNMPEDWVGGSYTGGPSQVRYDPETKTALMEFNSFGTAPSDLKEARLVVMGLSVEENGRKVDIAEENWYVPLTIEKLPEQEITLSGAVGTCDLRKLVISPLGVTVHWHYNPGALLSTFPFAVWLEDGSILKPRWAGSGGDGWIDNPDPIERDCWAFEDPDLAGRVTGISFGYWYIPIDGDTAGEGRWLTEMP